MRGFATGFGPATGTFPATPQTLTQRRARHTEPLGHANARFTLSVYAHALPGATERTAAALSRAVLGR